MLTKTSRSPSLSKSANTPARPSAIESILKKSEGSQRVLDEATESFELQILHEDEHAEEEEHAEEGTAVTVADPDVFDAVGQFNLICATCHGSAGDGNGAAGAALDPRPANFTDPAFWETRDDERIKTAIRDGGAAVGGSPLMAPWGVLFDDAQLDALVEYLKAFRPAGQ